MASPTGKALARCAAALRALPAERRAELEAGARSAAGTLSALAKLAPSDDPAIEPIIEALMEAGMEAMTVGQGQLGKAMDKLKREASQIPELAAIVAEAERLFPSS